MASIDRAIVTQSEGRPLPAWSSLTAAVIVAMLVWAFMQMLDPVFRVPSAYNIPNLGAPAEKFEAYREAQNRADMANAIVYLSLLGGCTAAAIGVAAGGFRRKLFGVLQAMLIGAAGGVAGGIAGALLYRMWVLPGGMPELTETLGVHAALLGPTGALVGLAIGRQVRVPMMNSLLGGLIAGLLAGVLYTFAASFFLPGADMGPLLPREGTSRLLWLASFAVLVSSLVFVAPVHHLPSAANGSRSGH